MNVPVDIQPTINSLPRNMGQSGTIALKLKKRLAYKSCDISENIRPLAVICALHYLMNNSEMYKLSGMQIDKDWINEIHNSTEEIIEDEDDIAEQKQDMVAENHDSDSFSEVDDRDIEIGNTDTLLGSRC